MIMATLEDLKQRLCQILSEAQAQGYKTDDIISEEVQEHFPGNDELSIAHEVIQGLKIREKTLESANKALQVVLKVKEEELADQPEDFKALKVDLKQARMHIDYYKQLAEDSQRRADRYQESLELVTKEQVAVADVAAKNEQLYRELTEHQSMIHKLQNENQRSAEIFTLARAADKKAMAANEAKLAAMLSHASQVENESEVLSEAFSNLIETLESDNVTSASLLNNKEVLLRKMEILYNVVVSEAAPLKRFFSRAFHVLQIYQILFRKLSDPYVPAIGSLPAELDVLMKGASEDLHAYHEIHEVLSGPGGAAEDQLRVELNGMSRSADGMLRSLYFVKGDVESFLGRLHAEPGTWLAMKAGFGGRRTAKLFEAQLK